MRSVLAKPEPAGCRLPEFCCTLFRVGAQNSASPPAAAKVGTAGGGYSSSTHQICDCLSISSTLPRPPTV